MKERRFKAPSDIFVLKRNQIIITALVIMIAIAGYLTWLDSRPDDDHIGYRMVDGEIAALISPTGAIVGVTHEEADPWATTHSTTIYTMADDVTWPSFGDLDLSQILALPTNEDNITEAGEAIFVDGRSQTPFFVQARLNREQHRSGLRATLTEIINNDNVSDAQRTQAVEDKLEIQRRVERESGVESLLESKGFSEVYVRISDNGVDIIVGKETLTSSELAIILEAAMRKTGLNANQVFVSPMRR
ncbi:MAG: SpoIIIAH-like family protein [Defluviitaleaceae bacterium]|nr:SpoIIIAH-like family protein [Defluviitaleaceae bacterium]MCL2274630.1 SpoIIIAH-like family protein [Defluviitaleaceae bacterium]